MLNRYFHYKENGSTLGKEISAGILVSILSVCGMFINMQLMAKLQVSGSYNTAGVSDVIANGEIYAQFYFLSMLMAFLGSLLIGLVARLPLVQVSSLGLGTVLISLVGTFNGLTYYNLLAISFFSSILCAVIVSVPKIWRCFVGAVPEPVRKALPAAAGLLMVWIAVQLTGVFSVQASDISTYGIGAVLSEASDSVQLSGFIGFDSFSYATDKYHPLMLLSVVSVIVTVVAFLLFVKRTAHPYLYSLLLGTVVFLVTNICFVCISWNNFGMALDSLWGRLWVVGSEDALHHHLSKIISNLSIGEIFTEGLDFSAYTANGGNVFLLFLTGVLTVGVTCFLDAGASLRAIEKEMPVKEKDKQRALLCNMVCGVAAPLLGGMPLSLGKESYAGVRDGGRSGLTSVVAAIGYLISMFVWIVPFFFVTLYSYDIKFTMYGHYGATLQALTECSFAVANIVMVVAGLSMVARAMDMEWSDLQQAAPFIATVAVTFFSSSLAFGVTAGSLGYLLVSPSAKERRPTVANWVWGAFSLIFLILSVI